MTLLIPFFIVSSTVTSFASPSLASKEDSIDLVINSVKGKASLIDVVKSNASLLSAADREALLARAAGMDGAQGSAPSLKRLGSTSMSIHHTGTLLSFEIEDAATGEFVINHHRVTLAISDPIEKRFDLVASVLPNGQGKFSALIEPPARAWVAAIGGLIVVVTFLGAMIVSGKACEKIADAKTFCEIAKSEIDPHAPPPGGQKKQELIRKYEDLLAGVDAVLNSKTTALASCDNRYAGALADLKLCAYELPHALKRKFGIEITGAKGNAGAPWPIPTTVNSFR